MAGVWRVRSTSARSISKPVASPRACTTRRREWAASRVVAKEPSASRSKRTPAAIRALSWVGPSSVSTFTGSSSHRPAPASRVSWKWSSGLSSFAIAAAMPPWA
ncbi:hypothetical protein D3C87_1907680 [compost metagenome]